MISHSEQFARVSHAFVSNQIALYTHSVEALVDAGAEAAGSNVDTLRTILARSTVATRQWLGAGGAYDWLSLVPHQSHLGWASLPALPASAQTAAPALEWRPD